MAPKTPRGWKCPYIEGIAQIEIGQTEVTVTHNKGVANYPQVTPLQTMSGGTLTTGFWTPKADITNDSFKIKIFQAHAAILYFHYRV